MVGSTLKKDPGSGTPDGPPSRGRGRRALRWTGFGFLGLLAVLCATSASAQVYRFRAYDSNAGLPSNATYGVFQDSRGYVWFATDGGAFILFTSLEMLEKVMAGHSVEVKPSGRKDLSLIYSTTPARAAEVVRRLQQLPAEPLVARGLAEACHGGSVEDFLPPGRVAGSDGYARFARHVTARGDGPRRALKGRSRSDGYGLSLHQTDRRVHRSARPCAGESREPARRSS